MFKTDEQKKALKPLFFGLGLVILLVGAISDLYETQVGLLVALAIWILTVPALKVLGFYVEDKKNKKETEEKGNSSRTGDWVWKIIIAVLAVFVVIWGVSYIFGQSLGIRGSGTLASEDRKVSDFNKVEISGVGKLIIDQTGKESLTVSAEDNIIDRIETKVEGDTLKIRVKNQWVFWWVWPTKDIEYMLSVDDLERISISGSGEVNTEMLKSKKLNIRISGSGNADLSLEVEKLDINISGSGKFILDGTSTSQTVNISGSGDYDAKDLISSSAKITISGSGKAIIHAKDSLDIDISGSGNVKYLGSPDIDQEVSGSGKISKYKDE